MTKHELDKIILIYRIFIIFNVSHHQYYYIIYYVKSYKLRYKQYFYGDNINFKTDNYY